VVAQARKHTRDELGSELEAKATDDFCMAFGTASPAVFTEVFAFASTFAEAIAIPSLKTPAILELTAEPEAIAELPNLSSDLASTLRKGVAGLLDDLSSTETGLSVLVRQASLKAAREEFYRRAGLIRDDVERATSAVVRGSLGRSHTVEEERLLVEVCWLNRTIRTTDARSISNVAGDPAVERVDVPRRLAPDTGPLDSVLRTANEVRNRYGLSGRGVTVAVIDSEVALGHPALKDRVIHRRNYTQESWGTPDTHGTAVAGIIGAGSNEYTGVAPEVTIYNYKVLATHLASNATDFEGTLAIQHALEDGVRIANCSWGAGPARAGQSREARACDRAWRLGLTIVKSAGNNGPRQRTLTTPADAEGVIVVGATDGDGQKVESYSSCGPTQDARKRPHLVAPGGQVGVGLEGLMPSGGIGGIGYGTSYAAPHVVGLLALLLESLPDLSPAAQRDRLLQSCRKLNGSSANRQGKGLVSPDLLFL
jgi:serine protease AprX